MSRYRRPPPWYGEEASGRSLTAVSAAASEPVATPVRSS